MFKITIEKTTTERKTVDGSWEVIKEENGVRTHGYAPAREKNVKETTEIYTQVVDDLDLVAVIDAVNGKVKE